MSENEMKTGYSNKILYLSVPITGALIFMKTENYYFSISIALLILTLCSMSILYFNSFLSIRKTSFTIVGVVGFIFVSSASIFPEIKPVNFLFFIGVAFLSIYAEIYFSLISLLTYASLRSFLVQGSDVDKIAYLIIAMFFIILVKYLSDFVSLIYIFITMVSLFLVIQLILNKLSFNGFLNNEKLIDFTFMIISILLAYFMFLRKRKVEAVSIGTEVEIQEDITNSAPLVEVKEENIAFDFSELLSEENSLYNMVKAKEEIFEASILRAKLCGELASLVGANVGLASAGAFFSDCGKINSKNYIKESLILIKENQLPSELIMITKEHHFKFGRPESKEAALTMILFQLESILQFFSLKQQKFKAERVINNVTDSLLMAGKLDLSGLSISDYKKIKEFLIEEAPKNYDYFNRE